VKNPLPTGFAVIGVALAAAGCGGSSKAGSGGSGTGTNSAASAKAAFVSRLDKLCTRADAAFSATHNLQGEEAVVSHYVTMFSALKAPAELSSLYARYVTVLGKELTALKQGNQNELFNLAHSQAKPLVKQMGAFGCVTGS
jgi:hypothetical protein